MEDRRGEAVRSPMFAVRKSAEDSRTPKPCGSILAVWRALASWSAAVLCRFRLNRSTRPNVPIASSVHDRIALRDFRKFRRSLRAISTIEHRWASLRYSVSGLLDSIRYRCVLVLRKKALPETAGDAMKPLSSLFVAKTSKVRPGLRTVVMPS